MEQSMEMPQPSKSNGPVVGIIVVIIVLAIGAYYLFAQLQSQQAAREADQAAELSQSNKISDIEADVSAQQQDLDALDAQTQADLQELNAQ
jgi:uncharacterized protein HemX